MNSFNYSFCCCHLHWLPFLSICLSQAFRSRITKESNRILIHPCLLREQSIQCRMKKGSSSNFVWICWGRSVVTKEGHSFHSFLTDPLSCEPLLSLIPLKICPLKFDLSSPLALLVCLMKASFILSSGCNSFSASNAFSPEQQ